jgi:voltage-gated potassium channel Kch
MGGMGFGNRFRYWFDGMTARGAGAMIAMLFIVTVLLVLLVSSLVAASGTDPLERDFFNIAWASLMRAIDPGNMAGDQGSLFFLLAMLTVTVGGLFVMGTLIGIITTGIENRLDSMRKGRSFVAERGHTVLLGWSSQVFTVVSELIEANSSRRKACIAILAEKDKVEMEDELRVRIPRRSGTRVVCRTGCPIETLDLEIVNHRDASSVIILPPDDEAPDSSVIKTMLALVNNPARKTEPYHIVSILRSPDNLKVAEMVGGSEAQLILAGDIIARITAQTCRQPGLSSVYSELLGFQGNEIYFGKEKLLANEPFSRAVHAFEDSCLIGIIDSAGKILLNPPADTLLREDSGIVVVTADDNTIKVSGGQAVHVNDAHITAGPEAPPSPERILLLGWNRKVPMIIQELDSYTAPGSQLTLATEHGELEKAAATNLDLRVLHGDITDRTFLDSLGIGLCDHVIVQSCSEHLNPQQADARTLITLLHLRDIRKRGGHSFTIVTEMLDERNRRLAEVSNTDDFIVSDKLVSLLLTQISENRELKTVFEELFDPDGSEIYLKPAGIYVRYGVETNFHTIVASALKRGETALGYSTVEGTVINPCKSSPIRLLQGDRVVVLARD